MAGGVVEVLMMLLDREKCKDDFEKHFSKQKDALVEMVDYGAQLIERAYSASKKGLDDYIVVCVLFNHIVTMIDAVTELVSSGLVHPASMQARSAFEASIFIEWMLKEKTLERATFYYVSDLRNRRIWALRMLKGTAEQSEFEKDLQDMAKYLAFNDASVRKMAQEELEYVEGGLRQSDFVEVNSRFQKYYRKNKREADWYQPLLGGRLRKMAKEVGRFAEYAWFYEKSSRGIHAASPRDYTFSLGNGLVGLLAIRRLDDIHDLLGFVVYSIILHTYRIIIGHYLTDDEMTVFRRTYIDNWRKAFL